ncbi:hypothetical protein Asppvi_005832 [Aspergillus pseudoviridinutans]|uniref:Uncharacterized protein n=1 Tax=Aspergillus pseudoviridinutans TaxID=1517512 RepID=A0A9P3EVD0_9EURO|nr:uncharacterized protein Asppvi_005832 [Aspergillus pseudoviridinutans]GIJ86933.1 hypothetical protein Asppvi_005832 [Aspergillus pseudoviridinutans]
MESGTGSEVSRKLRELATAMQSAGDDETAKILRKISNSRGLITSFRAKILSADPDLDPKKWFKYWQSESADKLSDKQAIRLAALTESWNHRTGKDIETLKHWISNPSAFWGMNPFRTPFEFVQHCLELADRPKANRATEIDGKKADGKEPIRRRVSLIILYDIIHEEVSRLRSQSNQLRHQKYLTSAVNNVVAKAYHSQNASERTKLHTRLTRLQRCGEKWSQLKRREMVLAPLDDCTTNFEKKKNENIVIEALNAFEETRDDEYRKHLRLAFKSIYEGCILQRNAVSASGLNLSVTAPSHHHTSSTSALSETDTTGQASLKTPRKRRSIRTGSSEEMHSLPSTARKRLKPVRGTEPRICSKSPSHYPDGAPDRSPRDADSPASTILPLQAASSQPSHALLSGDVFSLPSHSSPVDLARTTIHSQHQGSIANNGLLISRRTPAISSDFPDYNPLEHLFPASVPSQRPGYNPRENQDQASVHSLPAEDNPRECLDQSSSSSQLPGYNSLEHLVSTSIPSQLPDYNPLENPGQASAPSQPADDNLRERLAQSSFPSQFPGYNPLQNTDQASFSSQLPDYNPLENFVQGSFSPQLPDYDPLENFAQASFPSQLPDYDSLEKPDHVSIPSHPLNYDPQKHFVQPSVSQLFPDYNPLDNFAQSQVTLQPQEYDPPEHLTQSPHSHVFPDYNLFHMHAAT